MSWKKLYQDLMQDLRRLPAAPSVEELLGALQEWLRANASALSASTKSGQRYGLEEYAGMDLRRYPLEHATLDAAEEIERLSAVPPVSLETLAMRIRDIFWSGLTTESSLSCPQCDGSALRRLQDADSSEPVLACDQCAWAQTPSGERWRGRRVVPALRTTVERWPS